MDDNGRCPHGVYVGGCGADYLCGWCEDGIGVDTEEWQEYVSERAARQARQGLIDAYLEGKIDMGSIRKFIGA